MLTTARLICFSATTQPDAARHFYQHVLGLVVVEDGPFALVLDANGTSLRIQKVQELTRPTHTTLGWEVADVRAEVARLGSRGVQFERYPGMAQDDHGIWQSPSGALVAWFKDPDGQILSLTEWPSGATQRKDEPSIRA